MRNRAVNINQQVLGAQRQSKKGNKGRELKIIKYNELFSKGNFQVIEDIIQNDGVIVYPTDTLYGLGGNFFSLRVIKKIDELKKRADIPYSLAVSGLPMIEKLSADIPAVFYDLYDKIFPGKFTCLFRISASLDRALVKNSTKIGIRVPGVPGILRLIEKMDTPLISTSVNRSGQEPLRDPVTIRKEFPQLDILIDAGPLPESKGSTIIDLTESPIKVIRPGDEYEKIRGLEDLVNLFKTGGEIP